MARTGERRKRKGARIGGQGTPARRLQNAITIEEWPQDGTKRSWPPSVNASTTGNCGDTVMMDIEVTDGKIKEISFITNGCGSLVICCNALIRMVKGRSVEYARSVEPPQVAKAVGNLPEDKKHCAVLAVRSLNNVLDRVPGVRTTGT